MEQFNVKCESYADFERFAYMLEEDYGSMFVQEEDNEDSHIHSCPECGEPIYFSDVLNEDLACPACEFNGMQDQ